MNIDISATLTNPLITADSNPGRVGLGSGGVGHNIALNLHLMGLDVKFATLFGGDTFGRIAQSQCQAAGLDITLSESRAEERNGLYLCVNNHGGDMIVAVADTDIVRLITPQWLSERAEAMAEARAVVADTNLSDDALAYMLDHCSAPLFVDGVSTTKALRIVNALRAGHKRRLFCLKLNEKEALSVTCCDTVADAARRLIDLGIEQVYITLGARGVYVASPDIALEMPAEATEVVNTTGAGDAFLAGVVYGYATTGGGPQALARYGLAAARAALQSAEAVNPNIANLI